MMVVDDTRDPTKSRSLSLSLVWPNTEHGWVESLLTILRFAIAHITIAYAILHCDGRPINDTPTTHDLLSTTH